MNFRHWLEKGERLAMLALALAVTELVMLAHQRPKYADGDYAQLTRLSDIRLLTPLGTLAAG